VLSLILFALATLALYVVSILTLGAIGELLQGGAKPATRHTSLTPDQVAWLKARVAAQKLKP
jgi:hypothetical protein